MRFDWKLALAVLVYLALGIGGDLILKDGMAKMPSLDGFTPSEVARLLRYVFTTPQVGLGVALLAMNFGMLLAVLSSADLSVVGPARAISYLFLTLMAQWVLHEHVSPLRWLGVLLITGGVGLILSTTRSDPQEGKVEQLTEPEHALDGPLRVEAAPTRRPA